MPDKKAIAIVIMTLALAALAVTWVYPAVGGHGSACDRAPYAAGCR